MTEGVRVAVQLQPGARREALGGPVELADGAVLIKAWVSAPPEGGKANARLLALLAKAWKSRPAQRSGANRFSSAAILN